MAFDNLLGRARGALVGLAVAVLVTAASASPALAATGLDRIGGADRYETMERVVRAGFSSADTILVTTGEGYADALSAAGLAGANRCPVVLTPKGRLPSQVLPLATSLGVRRAIVVGGTASVSDAVASSLKKAGISVERVAGADRVATSVETMRAARAAGSTSDTVVVASGDSFADALSVGPWCWRTASPLVLVKGGTISAAAVSAIRSDSRVRRVVIVGGVSAVSDDVLKKLGDSYEYVRLGGSDRYETSANVAAWCCGNGLTLSSCGLATGTNFPDSLAASALLGKRGNPLLLASPGHAGTAAKVVAGVPSVTVLGGEGAVPASVANEVAGRQGSQGGAGAVQGYVLSGRVHVHNEVMRDRPITVVSLTLRDPVRYEFNYRGRGNDWYEAREVELANDGDASYGTWAAYDGRSITVACDSLQLAYHDGSFHNVDAFAHGNIRLVSVDDV